MGVVTVSALLFAPASQASLLPDDGTGETRAQCLQRCLSQYLDNMEACKSACTVCDTYIWFICVHWKLDQSCYSYCEAQAVGVSEACKAACPAE
jgi:hypothetical protein